MMDPGVIVAVCTLAGAVFSAIVGVIGYLFKGWLAANDAALAKAEARLDKAEKERDTFRALLKDAIATLPVAVNSGLERQGLPAVPIVVPIVPISHSPTTPEQEREAEAFTALAAIAAAKLLLGMPPRVAEKLASSVTIETSVKEVARADALNER